MLKAFGNPRAFVGDVGISQGAYEGAACVQEVNIVTQTHTQEKKKLLPKHTHSQTNKRGYLDSRLGLHGPSCVFKDESFFFFVTVSFS